MRVTQAARYCQLYSRIGFVHEYRPLPADELTFVLQHHGATIGLTLSAESITDTKAIAAVHLVGAENLYCLAGCPLTVGCRPRAGTARARDDLRLAGSKLIFLIVACAVSLPRSPPRSCSSPQLRPPT